MLLDKIDIARQLQSMTLRVCRYARGHPRGSNPIIRSIAQFSLSHQIEFISHPIRRFSQIHKDDFNESLGRIDKYKACINTRAPVRRKSTKKDCLSISLLMAISMFPSAEATSSIAICINLLAAICIAPLAYFYFVKRKEIPEIEVEHDWLLRSYHDGINLSHQEIAVRQIDMVSRFFSKSVLPQWYTRISAHRKTLERLYRLKVDMTVKLLRTQAAMSIQESRQITRSFGGIASEICILFDLIASLTLSETHTPSPVVNGSTLT